MARHPEVVIKRIDRRTAPPRHQAQTPSARNLLQLQRTIGNRAVAAIVQDPPQGPEMRRSGCGGPVVQRVNSFYTDYPKAQEKESPLATIAGAVQADTNIPGEAVVKRWRQSADLKVAKTAREALTSGPMQTISRPDEAAAWLDTPNPNPGTRKDPNWITAYGNLGTVEDQIMGHPVKKYNGGHLIAWEFLNEAANVKGNIAPQALTQNQALYRRIERTLEARAGTGQGGIEAIVRTPYQADPYTVTYQQLIERGVIADPTVCRKIAQLGLGGKAITLAQMAPDTYDLYVLTQTGTATPAPADKREAREGIKTTRLVDYAERTANKTILEDKPPALSILATNVNPLTMEQEVFAFAHQVYLNYRTTPLPLVSDDAPQRREVKRKRALEVINENMQLAMIVIRALEDQFDMSPTAAESALIEALIESEAPPDEDVDMG